ncbi:MAG: serine hydrolase domain-containing protein, partial [Gammaproteobacteria bacterium]|nr:serine hydrolase domain-containing protein [Gammaproteobacteria bacterium]
MQLSTELDARGARYPLAGTYEPEFKRVVDAFCENFVVEDEVGAACSIMIDGNTVVDIYGGWRDSAKRRVWDAPTTVCMMSVAKGITAICFNMLIDRGLVDADAYVVDYWPEYGQNGKEKTRVRHFLDHTAAVPVLTTDPLWPGAMFDREAIVKALEIQEPLWEIGTKAAYHVHHQGFLLGEIM